MSLVWVVILSFFLVSSVAPQNIQRSRDPQPLPYGLGYGRSYPYHGYGGLSSGGFILPLFSYQDGGLGYGQYGSTIGSGENPYYASGKRYYGPAHGQNTYYSNYQ